MDLPAIGVLVKVELMRPHVLWFRFAPDASAKIVNSLRNIPDLECSIGEVDAPQIDPGLSVMFTLKPSLTEGAITESCGWMTA